MGLREAKMYWRNFFRQAVGKSKIVPVKVVRNEEAKEFPLIHIKKEGDVGYDLPAIRRTIIPAPNNAQRQEFIGAMRRAERYRELNNRELAETWEKKAYASLPRVVIPTGIRLEMPNNVWCSIEARSSASSKMLITPDAIIDAGYRGELFAVVFNLGFSDYVVERGERVVQVIFHERLEAEVIEVDELSDSQRGESGFGSTGD